MESPGFLFPHLGQYTGARSLVAWPLAFSISTPTSSATAWSPLLAAWKASSMSLVALLRAVAMSFSHSGLGVTGVLTLSRSPFSVLRPHLGQKLASLASSSPHPLQSTIVVSESLAI